MKLHTDIKQCNIGMIKSKVAWQLFYNLELTPEEAELVEAYQLGEHVLTKYTNNEGNEGYIEVGQAVKGKGGNVYHNLGQINALKVALIEGCARLCDHLRQLQEIRAGGGRETIVYDLHPPRSQAQAGDAPPVVAQS